MLRCQGEGNASIMTHMPHCGGRPNVPQMPHMPQGVMWQSSRRTVKPVANGDLRDTRDIVDDPTEWGVKGADVTFGRRHKPDKHDMILLGRTRHEPVTKGNKEAKKSLGSACRRGSLGTRQTRRSSHKKGAIYGPIGPWGLSLA